METVRVSVQEVATARGAEAARIRKETAIKRVWWGPRTKFHTLAQAQAALRQGALVPIPREGDDYRLISKLDGTQAGEPNLLRPIALVFLTHTLEQWRRQLGTKLATVRLAITSLYRDQTLQAKLKASQLGYGAVGLRESSHLAGAAIDISCRSYYLRAGEDLTRSQAWRPETGFDPEPLICLQEILRILAYQGLCNFVIENRVDIAGVLPSVYHLCVAPTFGGETL